jgi:uncharacterized protein with von Willebrand factor type A (vWA) domain
MGALAKIKDLAGRAGRWLGLGEPTPLPTATRAVVTDGFDDMTWQEAYDQAPKLRELVGSLRARYNYAADLVQDTFMTAYKPFPEVRPVEEMDPTRRANHQIIAGLRDSPEMSELRRSTAGDKYGAVMATLAMAPTLREAMERAKQAAEAGRKAAEDAQAAAEAAAAVTAAMEQAEQTADEDGAVPDEQAEALAAAVDAAEQAEAQAQGSDTAATEAAQGAAAGVRAALREATAKAEQAAREEAEMMAAWGIEPGKLEIMDFAEREALAKRLRGSRLGQFADLIGRFRSMASAARKRKLQNVAGELVGVTLGDDITRMIPTEMVALAVPGLREELISRLVQGQVLVYDTQGEEKQARGPLIVLVDCSGSMCAPDKEGMSREMWAKALTLALLDQARATRPTPRDFVVILFSSAGQMKTFRFPASRPVEIADVLEMVEHFYQGGTDFEAPINAGVEILLRDFAEDGHANGDLVMITDDECEVSEAWMGRYLERKRQAGFHMHGVPIGARRTGPVLQALADRVLTITDLTTPDEAHDLFTTI